MTLHGLDKQISAFRAAMAGERMHHAWLLAGPKGVGKASFARAAAHRLLAEASTVSVNGPGLEVSEEHPTSRLIAARSHSDYKLVEREVWQKNVKDRLVPYGDRKGDEERARNIRIAQIRWLEPILAMAPAMSSRRVVLIDAADDLERSAGNALLKMLEEPPSGTIFLLVSHQPGRLLPTIRSRCSTLMFAPLDDAAMTSVLDAQMPDLDPVKRTQLIASANGSVATALAYAENDMATLDVALVELAQTGDPTNAIRGRLSQTLALKTAASRYEAFLRRAPAFIAEQARRSDGAALAAALSAWSKAQALSQIAIPQSLVAETVVFELAGMVASLAPSRGPAKA